MFTSSFWHTYNSELFDNFLSGLVPLKAGLDAASFTSNSSQLSVSGDCNRRWWREGLKDRPFDWHTWHWHAHLTGIDWHAHAPKLLNRFLWFFSANDAAWRVEVPFWIYFRLIHIKWSKLDQNSFAQFDWHAHAPKLLNIFSWIMHHSTRLGLKRCRFEFYSNKAYN